MSDTTTPATAPPATRKTCPTQPYPVPSGPPAHLRVYTTAVAASITGHKAATYRESYCRNGHYLGVVPIKLPSGRLRWPADAIDRLLRPESD